MKLLAFLAFTSNFLCATTLFAAEELAIDFSYERVVNLGSVQTAIKLAEFGDERGLAANALVDGYTLNAPLADLVRDAIAQGFASGGVELAEADHDMQLIGTILSAEAETIDRGGVATTQLTLRTRVQLQDDGRTVWETTLFGRGRTPQSEGMAAAVNAALGRTVRELFNDDYFVIALRR